MLVVELALEELRADCTVVVEARGGDVGQDSEVSDGNSMPDTAASFLFLVHSNSPRGQVRHPDAPLSGEFHPF